VLLFGNEEASFAWGEGGPGCEGPLTWFEDGGSWTGAPPFLGTYKPEDPEGMKYLNGPSGWGAWLLDLTPSNPNDRWAFFCWVLSIKWRIP
jgi:hypothetical protein